MANTVSPMRRFDPVKLGRYEKENWVAYYRKDWPALLRVSVRMVKEAFGLSWLKAPYAAYLVARAEMAAAPAGNDIPLAERYMRLFYTLIKTTHHEHEQFNVDEAARLEVNWWVVHRQLFGQTENGPLVDALTALYAATYGLPADQVRDAAYHRAQAMVYSDRWVNQGRANGSSLLKQEEDELIKSYTSLRAAVAPSPHPAAVPAFDN